MMSAVVEKEISLNRLSAAFAADELPNDLVQFLEDVVVGANYGWNQGQPRESTFQEALSSGKFGLLRDRELRSAISNYYNLFRSLYVRADARETAFPHISYQLVPRSRGSERAGILLSPEVDLTDAQIQPLAEAVMKSPLRDHVMAEINLARFIQRMTTEVQREQGELIGMIEAYRN